MAPGSRRTSLIAALALSGFALVAMGPTRPDEPATVEEAMESIEHAIEELPDQLGKPDALKTVWELERLALAAKSMTPKRLKGGASEENLAAYRKAQIELVRRLLDLEAQIIDGKTDEARQTLDAIDELRLRGHRQFKGRAGW